MATRYGQESGKADAELERIQAVMSKADEDIDYLKAQMDEYERQVKSTSDEQELEILGEKINETDTAITKRQRELDEVSMDLSSWYSYWMKESD